MEAQRVHVEPVLGHDGREVAERVLERLGLRVGVHEHERPPRAHRHRREAELVLVEAGLVLAPRRSPERAVEAVGPRVVRALDRAPLLRLVHQDRAAVAADVEVPAELAVLVEDNHHRKAAHLGGEEAPWPVELAGVPGVLPRAPKDPLALRGQDGRVGVPAVRRRLDARRRPACGPWAGYPPKVDMRKQISRTESGSSVGTLARGLDILELFAGESPALTQKEISERLGLPVPTVHRLTKLLVERGWLVRDAGSRRLRIGLGVARLLPALLSGLRLPELARDHVRGLAERSGETVNLAVLHGGEVVYLLSESGSRLLTLRSTIGLRLPVHCTALGKCLLAQIPDDEARRAAGPRAVRGAHAGNGHDLGRAAKEPRASAPGRASRCPTRSTRRGSTRSPCRSPGWRATGPAAVNVSLPSTRAVGNAAGRPHARAARGGAGDRGRRGHPRTRGGGRVIAATAPYWLDSPYEPRPPLEGDLEVDVCVIGAGVCGLSCARRLAQHGIGVVVLERGTVAGGRERPQRRLPARRRGPVPQRRPRELRGRARACDVRAHAGRPAGRVRPGRRSSAPATRSGGSGCCAWRCPRTRPSTCAATWRRSARTASRAS